MVQAYSIGKSKRQDFTKINNTQTPGSDTYNYDKTPKQISPKWSMGTSPKFNWKLNENPGPGTYTSKFETESKVYSNPSFVFGLKLKDQNLSNLHNPESGVYNPSSQSVYNKSPSFTMRPRTNDVNYQPFQKSPKNKSPGPGYYDTDKSTVTNLPSTLFGMSYRQPFSPKDNFPGAGRYIQIEYQTQFPKYTFGKEARNEKMNPLNTSLQLPNLGPTLYNLKSSIRTDIGFQMTSRNNDIEVKEIQSVPGPGQYNQDKTPILHKAQFNKIGKEKRILDLKQQKNMANLGPDKYSPSYQQTKEKQPQYVFGTSQRVKNIQNGDFPSPDTYKIEKEIGYKKPGSVWSQFTEERKNQEFFKNPNDKKPSPFHYEVNLKQSKEKSPAYVIGISARINGSRSLSPGPGRYNIIPAEQSPQFSFGNEQREKQYHHNQNPGPGAYKIKGLIGEVPKYIINDTSQKKIKLEE